VELARRREKSIAEIAHDLGIAESCLRRWLKQDDIDAGRAEGLSIDERAELMRLHRGNRVQVMEIGILKRASAYFAREACPAHNDAPMPVKWRRRLLVHGRAVARCVERDSA